VELGSIIALDLLIDAILIQIGEKACEALNADRYSIFLYDDATHELCTTVALGMGSEQIRIPVDSGIAGHCFTTGKTVNIRNAYTDPRFNKEIDSITGYHTKTLLAMPFYNRARQPIGVVELLNKKKGLFTREDEAFLQTFNNYAAVFIEMAQLQKARIDAIEQSRQELERLNKAKSKALDHLAHELKTPLAVAKGNLRLLGNKLKAKYQDDSFQNLTDSLGKNLQRLLAIQEETEKIIRVSKELETGVILEELERLWRKVEDFTGIPSDVLSYWNAVKGWMMQHLPGLPMPMKRIDLLRYVQTAVKKAQYLANDRRISYEVAKGNGSYITMNAEVLKDVIEGILKNAVENTPDGGSVRIDIKRDNNRIILTVKDTGTGIREENQHLIFDGLYHTKDSDIYSSKRPYEFGAGGKGLDLFRIKTYGQRFGFEVHLASKRCPNIPSDLDLCPGDVERCDRGTTPHYCTTSGGTTVAVMFPVKCG
jgi:signal transduction histidine kinase